MLITAHLDVCFSLILLNSVGGVGSVGAWVAWVKFWHESITFWLGSKKMAWVAWVGILAWVAWVHYILARVKKKSVGRNFGMGLRCFIIKIFLKNSQNLQENICAGVCSLIKFQAEGLKKKRDFSTGVFL